MKVIGAFLLAVGSGLGVWMITNPGDTGVIDILIVLALVLAGAFFVNVREEED